MTQREIDWRLPVIERHRERRDTLALEAVRLAAKGPFTGPYSAERELRIHKLVRRADGHDREARRLEAKADRISQRLYGCDWCVASTFHSDRVAMRRHNEAIREEETQR